MAVRSNAVTSPPMIHPTFHRREALRAGAIGLLGLGINHLAPLRAAVASETATLPVKARSVVFIFLSGGLGQLDSFDMKPDAPAEIRGEFKPIATKTPGLSICEHLPLLAQCSDKWSLVRSLTHSTNDHSAGHLMMLTGRSTLPPGFDPAAAKPTDWPSIAAIAGAAVQPRNNLPPAVVLPERLVHNSGRVIPGQFAGQMGRRREPWFIEASPFDPMAYGAFPQFDFDHQDRTRKPRRSIFETPALSLPEGVGAGRLADRMRLLELVDRQRAVMERAAAPAMLDHHRQAAVSLISDAKVRRAVDVMNEDPKTLDRYGRNSFGWSLLMTRRLVEAGVSLVQVNLGNNETWDTHGNAFPHLKDALYPPTDRALSTLLGDLSDSGLLGSTLVVMAGEFGRTPKISTLPAHYKLPGRDHWGAVQSVFFAGGGVQGGRVVGATDKIAGHPISDAQTPENFAATIYHVLGLPPTAEWKDELDRPHFIYHGDPIRGLF
jgi:uncharacterized protein (DUF1501 family)